MIADFLNGTTIFISFITEIELYSYHNINSLVKKILNEFIESAIIVEMGDFIKQSTNDIRKSKKVKNPNAIIAASALSNKLSLIRADKALLKIGD